MRKNIAQRAGKALLQFGSYGLLVGALLTPASGWAGWTLFGKVIATQSHSDRFLIWLDATATTNINGCTNYLSNYSELFGMDIAGFEIEYPASGTPSEAQKIMISQVSLAAATGKPVLIMTSSCSSILYNAVDEIVFKPN
ncbi:hypothetical protein [Methylomonas methanica]|uniref:Uncharacterized protein n=1 Tax=Methylomonas methanica (strain DSM 25384 / MC09) TaxID=857087 RepID=F9ZWR1_METMM|nr:hypothetical protein [Methylomonas methanica]AEG00908.1 hypothetical protein Metme_2517 [Methylomonas methanica MC09]